MLEVGPNEKREFRKRFTSKEVLKQRHRCKIEAADQMIEALMYPGEDEYRPGCLEDRAHRA